MAGESKEKGGTGTMSVLLKRRRSFPGFSERIEAKELKVLQYCTSISMQTQVNLDEAWEYIAWGIDIVLHLLESKSSRKETKSISMKFYSGMYSLVCSVQQRAPLGAAELYKRYKECFEEYLSGVVAPAIKGKHGDEQLHCFIEKWNKHKILSEWMRRFFEILDRGLVAGTNHDSLSAVAVKKFKTTLFDNIKSDLVPTMLATVAKHRRGEKELKSVQLMHDCSEIFQTMGIVEAKQFSKIKCLVNPGKATKKGKFVVMPELKLLADSTGVGSDAVIVADELHIYLKDYETPFLADTTTYCQRMASKWMLDDSVPTYLQQAEAMLTEERTRVSEYLHTNTEEKLIRCVVKNILANPKQKQLLENAESGLAVQLKEKKLDNVAAMFRCFKLVEDYKLDGGLEPMAEIFYQWVMDTGNELIGKRARMLKKKDAKGRHIHDKPFDHRYVEELKGLHIRCKDIVKEQLGNHPVFQKAVNKAFDTIVNHSWSPKSKPKLYHGIEELLVYYCDMVLKGYKMRTRLTSEQQDKLIKEVLDLFDCLWTRDVFVNVYKEKMCERLLASQSSSMYMEENLLGLLQVKQGAAAVQTMDAMLRDLKQVEKVQADWAKFRDSNKACRGIKNISKMSTKLLSNQAWAVGKNPTEEIALPAPVSDWCEAFTNYYHEKFPRKDILFRHDLTQVSMKVVIGKPYNVLMKAPQAAIFLLFKQKPRWGVAELREKLNLSKKTLECLLDSFLRKPVSVPDKEVSGGLLAKGPKPGPPILDSEFIMIRMNFRCKAAKFKANEPMYKVRDSRGVPPGVIQDRKNQIDAALVRTMKARGVMNTNDLVQEAIKQLHRWYRPTTRDIKAQIDALIEKEYMIRRPDDPKMLEYKA